MALWGVRGEMHAFREITTVGCGVLAICKTGSGTTVVGGLALAGWPKVVCVFL